jgi:hypothetical protein
LCFAFVYVFVYLFIQEYSAEEELGNDSTQDKTETAPRSSLFSKYSYGANNINNQINATITFHP